MFYEGTTEPIAAFVYPSMYVTLTKQQCFRGYLDYEQPISRYWPEYGQNGKEKTTLKQLLSLKVCWPPRTCVYNFVTPDTAHEEARLKRSNRLKVDNKKKKLD